MSADLQIIIAGLALAAFGGVIWVLSGELGESHHQQRRQWSALLGASPPDRIEDTNRWAAVVRIVALIQMAAGGLVAAGGVICGIAP